MDKRDRQAQILDVLGRNRIDSQQQLVDLLAAEGVTIAQSTLSRDLRELGVVKSTDGYRVPGRASTPRALESLAAEFAARVRTVDVGGSIVVIRLTVARHAEGLAERIEDLGLARVVAAVPGGRTVMVITRSAADAREIVRHWKGAGAAR